MANKDDSYWADRAFEEAVRTLYANTPLDVDEARSALRREVAQTDAATPRAALTKALDKLLAENPPPPGESFWVRLKKVFGAD